ncbi:hypothetical protein H8K33_08135 [Undibacterium amnicola]|uniref:Uncharacterized protein n=1 Tax=Undibacterium amnicola TaxID=1834038 RepID=A0ABR6XPQ9_9BURK|nr:hypothetical protein [Undibacterium amnicola]MBC3831475.1 hypothetical protein [Undibacterium amnicola]
MDINYTSPSIAPNLTLFACEKLHAQLTPQSCSNHFENSRYIQCVGCPIGEYHTPKVSNNCSNNRSQNMAPNPACTRCQKAGRRLVFKKTLCISCANREYEVRKGKNSKGTEPILAQSRLRRVVVTLIHKENECNWEGLVVDESEAKRVIERLYFGALISTVFFYEHSDGGNQSKE